MDCPKCHAQMHCYESRASNRGDIPHRRRRYKCERCDERYSTREFIEVGYTKVAVLSLPEVSLLDSLRCVVEGAVYRYEHR